MNAIIIYNFNTNTRICEGVESMNKIKHMLIGRYGMDHLNIALLIIVLILSLITAFSENKEMIFICWIPFLLYAYRSFSKQHILRYKENAIFLKLLNPIRKPLYIKFGRMKDKKHKYLSCPSCNQTIRVEKQKGKINISCPICKTEFMK